jgi:hypothetical protein
MERKRGVQFSAVLLASDSATLIDTITSDPASAGLRSRIGVMYDWERTVSVLEEVDEHTHVPREKKRDLQDHLVATLYAMVQVRVSIISFLQVCCKEVLLQIKISSKLPPKFTGPFTDYACAFRIRSCQNLDICRTMFQSERGTY